MRQLQQLQRISILDEIVVNFNDDEILAIAEKYRVKIAKRDSFYASNEVSMSDVYKNIAENMDCDVIVYANCTNPLIHDKKVSEVIEYYKENFSKYNSINTAHSTKEFLFKDNLPINYDFTEIIFLFLI